MCQTSKSRSMCSTPESERKQNERRAQRIRKLTCCGLNTAKKMWSVLCQKTHQVRDHNIVSRQYIYLKSVIAYPMCLTVRPEMHIIN